MLSNTVLPNYPSPTNTPNVRTSGVHMPTAPLSNLQNHQNSKESATAAASDSVTTTSASSSLLACTQTLPHAPIPSSQSVGDESKADSLRTSDFAEALLNSEPTVIDKSVLVQNSLSRMAQSNKERLLQAYIYDYFLKRGFFYAAAYFAKESGYDLEPQDMNPGGVWSTAFLAQTLTSAEIKSSLVMKHSVLWDDDIDHPYLLDWFQSHMEDVTKRSSVDPSHSNAPMEQPSSTLNDNAMQRRLAMLMSQQQQHLQQQQQPTSPIYFTQQPPQVQPFMVAPTTRPQQQTSHNSNNPPVGPAAAVPLGFAQQMNPSMLAAMQMQNAQQRQLINAAATPMDSTPRCRSTSDNPNIHRTDVQLEAHHQTGGLVQPQPSLSSNVLINQNYGFHMATEDSIRLPIPVSNVINKALTSNPKVFFWVMRCLHLVGPFNSLDNNDKNAVIAAIKVLGTYGPNSPQLRRAMQELMRGVPPAALITSDPSVVPSFLSQAQVNASAGQLPSPVEQNGHPSNTLVDRQNMLTGVDQNSSATTMQPSVTEKMLALSNLSSLNLNPYQLHDLNASQRQDILMRQRHLQEQMMNLQMHQQQQPQHYNANQPPINITDPALLASMSQLQQQQQSFSQVNAQLQARQFTRPVPVAINVPTSTPSYHASLALQQSEQLSRSLKQNEGPISHPHETHEDAVSECRKNQFIERHEEEQTNGPNKRIRMEPPPPLIKSTKSDDLNNGALVETTISADPSDESIGAFLDREGLEMQEREFCDFIKDDATGKKAISDYKMDDYSEDALDRAVADASMDAEVVGSDAWLEGLMQAYVHERQSSVESDIGQFLE